MNLFEKQSSEFVSRHIGPNETETKEMLKEIGLPSMEELIDKTIPANIRLQAELNIPNPISEFEYLKELREVAKKNKIFINYIGQGYYDTIVPGPILRNLFENPGWYTAYTPYQAEIAQGRLEGLLNFQTMVADLTGLDIANASLLDEATAAAEAMTMLHSVRINSAAHRFFVAKACHPQTLDVVRTRAVPQGIEVVIDDAHEFNPDSSYFGAL